MTAVEKRAILRLPTIDLTGAMRASLNAGEKLSFFFASKVVHLFDPEMEENILY